MTSAQSPTAARYAGMYHNKAMLKLRDMVAYPESRGLARRMVINIQVGDRVPPPLVWEYEAEYICEAGTATPLRVIV